ncbi:TonB-dependent receptor [uncultured Sphingomonas sp.]|uniref:TonB-dependent receptor domain-containing protein n=1 Tax=uncultured Sphingomonas sp. TaxID=158754 RepID=UPI0025CB7F8D|nr:TonB-dependent receptor [uncultured Sphingomonas sp.]
MRAGIGASLIAMAWCGVASAQTVEQPVKDDATISGVAASADKIDAKQEATDPSDVVVTGTRIVRPNMESNAPITTIDATYLKERGLARIEDALAQLPQVTPMLGLQGSTWTSGAAPVGLRNLGSGRTLTLLNGQRMDNDVNIIPGALIDRIDIMTGGASAVYGSDAIAGVVNFIVKRKFNGIAFDGEVSGFNHNNNSALLAQTAKDAGYTYPRGSYLGGGNYFASVAAGQNLLGDRLNISAFATYKKADPIQFRNLDTTNCPLQMFDPNNIDAGNTKWTCYGTTYNPYNYFGINNQDLSNARDGSRSFRPYDTADEVRVQRVDNVQRRSETVNAGGFLTADLPVGMRLTGSFLYSKIVERGFNSVDGGMWTPAAPVNCDNPFLGRAQAQAICGAAAGTTALSDPISLSLFRPGMIQNFRNTTDDWRGSLGLSGKIVDKIRFELSYQQTRNIQNGSGDHMGLSDQADRLARGLQVRNVNGVPTCLSKINGTDPNCQPVDAFSSNTSVSDAVYNWLTGVGSRRQQNDLQVINGIVSGTLEDYGLKSPWAESGIGFAITGEYRKYRNQSTGYGAWSNFTTFDGRTSVKELGGEIDIPLIENKPFFKELSVNGGYRISDYDIYDKLIHSWKAEASWSPFAGIRFRGSYNRAVRVGVQQRLEGENRYPNTPMLDLCAPPRAASNGKGVQRYTFDQCSIGMTRAQYDALTSYTGCDSQGFCPTTLVNGGNSNLQPERSRSKTLGVVLQPRFIPGLTASVDWYDINIQGAFEWTRIGMAFNQCYDNKVQFFCQFYQRDPQTGRLLVADARYNNSGYTATRGIDFATNYALDPKRLGIASDIGTFGLNFNGTLTTKFERQFAPGNTPWSCLGYFGFACGDPMPRWRHVAGVNWQLPWIKGGLGFTWRYTGPSNLSKLSSNTVLAAAPGQTYPLVNRIPGYSYFDFNTNVTLVKGIDVRFNVQNLFDKDPPLIGYDTQYAIGGGFNTFPTYYTVRGRTLRVGISARF